MGPRRSVRTDHNGLKEPAMAFGIPGSTNSNRSAEPSGHLPTLIASFLHFDYCFMLWVLLGALGIYIAESVGLGPAEKGLLVAVPILSGSLLRLPLGLLSDRF